MVYYALSAAVQIFKKYDVEPVVKRLGQKLMKPLIQGTN